MLSSRSGMFSRVALSSLWTTIFSLPFDLSISFLASIKERFSVTVPFIWKESEKEVINHDVWSKEAQLRQKKKKVLLLKRQDEMHWNRKGFISSAFRVWQTEELPSLSCTQKDFYSRASSQFRQHKNAINKWCNISWGFFMALPRPWPISSPSVLHPLPGCCRLWLPGSRGKCPWQKCGWPGAGHILLIEWTTETKTMLAEDITRVTEHT